jgi:cytoskeletal protein RodZ
MVCEGWEGLTIDGKFPLLEWLGGWADRCVFLTVRQSTNKANIKLIQASGADADAYVSRWEAAKNLPHPYLVQMMETGRYQLNGTDVAYVVTEKAETFLSGITPRKALGAAKVKEILSSIVEALSFVHEKRYVHGSVKPSSIVLIGEKWKLASDEMSRAGLPVSLARELDTYDAPEMGTGTLTAAADMWSLGIIVVETCSQRTPVWDRSAAGDLGVPDWLPKPFGEIARGCLRWDPAERISIAEVKNLLARTPVAASVDAGGGSSEGLAAEAEAARLKEPAVSTLSERVAEVRAARTKAKKEMHPAAAEPRFETEVPELSPRSRLFADLDEEDEEHEGRGGLLIFVLLVLLAIGCVLGVRYRDRFWPLIAKQNTPAASQPAPQTGSNPSQATPSDAGQIPAQSQPQPAPAESPKAGSEETESQKSAAQPAQAAPIQPPAAETQAPVAPAQADQNPPAQPAKEEPLPAEEPPAPRVMNAKGVVLKRVLPNVASGAVQSMRRPVQVDVRVSVNSNGSVSGAQCVTQSKGNYWAKISQQAAEEWKFKAPIREGHAQSSYWMLLFQYNRGKTAVVATQLH